MLALLFLVIVLLLIIIFASSGDKNLEPYAAPIVQKTPRDDFSHPSFSGRVPQAKKMFRKKFSRKKETKKLTKKKQTQFKKKALDWCYALAKKTMDTVKENPLKHGLISYDMIYNAGNPEKQKKEWGSIESRLRKIKDSCGAYSKRPWKELATSLINRVALIRYSNMLCHEAKKICVKYPKWFSHQNFKGLLRAKDLQKLNSKCKPYTTLKCPNKADKTFLDFRKSLHSSVNKAGLPMTAFTDKVAHTYKGRFFDFTKHFLKKGTPRLWCFSSGRTYSEKLKRCIAKK